MAALHDDATAERGGEQGCLRKSVCSLSLLTPAWIG